MQQFIVDGQLSVGCVCQSMLTMLWPRGAQDGGWRNQIAKWQKKEIKEHKRDRDRDGDEAIKAKLNYLRCVVTLNNWINILDKSPLSPCRLVPGVWVLNFDNWITSSASSTNVEYRASSISKLNVSGDWIGGKMEMQLKSKMSPMPDCNRKNKGEREGRGAELKLYLSGSFLMEVWLSKNRKLAPRMAGQLWKKRIKQWEITLTV